MSELKGTIPPGHIPANQYEMLIGGSPPYPGRFIPTSVKGLEKELETVDLPDRTHASGGQTKPGMMTITVPLHDRMANGYMNFWHKQGMAPVDPNYKKPVTLVYKSIHHGSLGGGAFQPVVRTIIGVFCKKPSTDDLAMKDEGNMVEQTWMLPYDDIRDF